MTLASPTKPGQALLNPSQEAVLRFLESSLGQFFRPRELYPEIPEYAHQTVRRVLTELRDQGLVKHFKKRHVWGTGEFQRFSYGFRWEEARDKLVHVIPVHEKYYGALIQAWSGDTELLSDKKDALKDKLRSELADWIGYEEGEWWFTVDDGEGLQTVDFDERLDDRYEWRIEAEDGSVMREGDGDLDEL